MRVGIVGGGMAGLVVAWLIGEHHEVTVFERERRAGGHARSFDIDFGVGGKGIIDVGVEFFGGAASYPLFHRLLALLAVRPVARPITATIHGANRAYPLVMPPWRAGAIDWRALSGRTILDLANVARLSASAARTEESALRALTIGEFLDRQPLPAEFKKRVAIPFLSAQLGTYRERFLQCTAYDALRYFVIFGFHGLRQLPVYTVSGGTRRYVEALAAALKSTRICLGAAIDCIALHGDGYAIAADGEQHRCDHLVLACDPASAAALMPRTEHSGEMAEIFRMIELFDTKIVVHGDPRVMPRSRRSWSAFNIEERDGQSALTVWYGAPGGPPLFRTWTNFETGPLDPVHAQATFRHMLGTHGLYEAQKRIRAIQGRDNLWFAGSWVRDNDSHESAIGSAVDVAAALDSTSRNLARLGGRAAEIGPGAPMQPQPDRASGS
jgi:predicted NAD/FAD-binding protein